MLVYVAGAIAYKEKIMGNFDQYVEDSPVAVIEIQFLLTSKLVSVIDPQTGDPIGVEEIEELTGRAVAVDQEGVARWVHTAVNYQELIDKGILTGPELQTIQTWLQNLRDKIEARILPQG
jgi:hypothetical protein